MLIPLIAQFLCIRIPVATLGFIIVEIPRISGAPQMRHNGSLDLTIIQAAPVDVLEPRVRFHAAGATTNVAEALGGVHCAKAGDEVASVGGHGGGKADFTFYDSGGVLEWGLVLSIVEEGAGDALFVDLHGVLVPEGGLADEEFID
jgi:hypothetical protein